MLNRVAGLRDLLFMGSTETANDFNLIRFEALTPLKISMFVLWVIKLCRLGIGLDTNVIQEHTALSSA